MNTLGIMLTFQDTKKEDEIYVCNSSCSVNNRWSDALVL